MRKWNTPPLMELEPPWEHPGYYVLCTCYVPPHEVRMWWRMYKKSQHRYKWDDEMGYLFIGKNHFCNLY